MDVSDECLKVPVVVVDRIKKLEESLDDFHIGLSEILVQVDQVDVVLDLRVDDVHIFQIVEVE